MYCITPTVGLVPITPASTTKPNVPGLISMTEPTYLGDAASTRISRPYNLANEFGYHQTYKPCMNFPVNSELARMENQQYHWDSAYFSHYFSQQMNQRMMEEESMKYQMENGGIPLKTYMMMEMKRNVQKIEMTAPLRQYREPAHPSTDESLSPTSSSGVLSSSKESSPYSSSSGRSSESGYDTHGTDNLQQYQAKKWAEQRTRQVHSITGRVSNGEVETSDYVRPRIRPSKCPRQVGSQKTATHTQSSHMQSNNVHAPNMNTPECGLISQRKTATMHVSSKRHPIHFNSEPIYVNCDAMDVEHSIYPTQQNGRTRLPERKTAAHSVGVSDRKATASPVKQRIQKFETLCESIAKAAYDKSVAQVQAMRDIQEVPPSKRDNGIKESKGNKSQQKSNRTAPPLNDLAKGKNANLSPNSKIEKARKDFGNSKKMFLGMYEVLAVLGVGGGGTVYSGTRISDSKPIAIKRIMREKVKRWEKVQGRKVPQEIVLMMKVNGHKNVIGLLDWYECLDSFILILERPPQCIDLFDYIREVGRIPEDEGATIFKQVVEAVRHIQSRGVLHRDIKDENIVINRSTKRPKIIDFGCGTNLFEGFYKDFSGTPEFYPPEWFIKHQYEGKSATTWSLGVLLYDMLCGEIPFKTKSKIMANVLNFKVSISPKAKHLIMWLLCSDPDARPDLSDILRHPWVQQ